MRGGAGGELFPPCRLRFNVSGIRSRINKRAATRTSRYFDLRCCRHAPITSSQQIASVQGMLMPLPFGEKLTMLMPPSLFYRRRIAEETRSGEPELAVLAKLVPRGGVAIDVGANLGFFAYALSDIADWVIAFEPNPDYAFFARWMLRGRAEVHQLALSDLSGRGTLYVPLSDRGMVLHLAGSLKQTYSQFRNIKTYDVEVRTLDEFGLVGVRLSKLTLRAASTRSSTAPGQPSRATVR
jgi:FkbM family methyltransferase